MVTVQVTLPSNHGNCTGDTKETRDARLLYEIETNYWIEHCKQLSKQLAERTHTIHVLLGDKPAR